MGLIGFIILAVAMVYTFVTQISEIQETNGDRIVKDKYTHKGLYFANYYYVEFSNGKTHGVFKRDFETLEKGDIFQPLFDLLSWKDFWLILFGTGLVFCLCIFTAYICILDLFQRTKAFQKFEDKWKRFIKWIMSPFQRNEKARERLKKGSFLILIIVLSIPYILMAKNALIKIVPVGNVKTIAEVQGHEKVRSTGLKRHSNTYTLLYTFKDGDNNSYKTKKDVSQYTYNRYADASEVPIVYRKSFPYDTFIDNQSLGEILSMLFRISNVIFLVQASLLVYFIKKYLDIWGMPFLKKT